MSENQAVIDLVNWLTKTETVQQWELAENFRGVKITQAASLNPEQIPDGWKVDAVFLGTEGGTLHVRKDGGA